MSIIDRGAVGLRLGGRGFTLLEWLFSNLVVARWGGDLFLPLAEKIFLRVRGGEAFSEEIEGLLWRGMSTPGVELGERQFITDPVFP